MEILTIKEIINKYRNHYAWIHSYDNLQILNIGKLDVNKVSEKHLIKMILFNQNEEITITPSEVSKSIEELENQFKCIKFIRDKKNKYIYEQQILAKNKVIAGGFKVTEGLEYFHVLKIANLLSFGDDGQAFIKKTCLMDIEEKEFSNEVEVSNVE